MGKALLVDFGGVLTTPVAPAFRTFCVEHEIPPGVLKALFVEAYADPSGTGSTLIAEVETGRISTASFNARLAAALQEHTGRTIPENGLIQGIVSRLDLDDAMLRAVSSCRAQGVRVALVSNSLGDDRASTGYPDGLESLFDAVVISGEVGVRKPHPAIFELAAGRLDMDPHACVFVDDVESHVRAAERLGITGVVHQERAETIAALESLLEVRIEV